MSLHRTSQSVSLAMPLKTIGLRATPFLLAFLAISLITLHRIGFLPVEKMRVTVTDVMSPALSVVSEPFVQVFESFEGIKTYRALKAENIRLQAENDRLMKWYEAALTYQAENTSLHELLNVKAGPDLSYVTARIVSDPGGAFVKSVLLPVGLREGLQSGNAVLSGYGLIGRITEVGQRSARVLLISDLNSRIPVVVQNTRTRAILTGRNGKLLRLERLPIDSGLSLGSRVVTSGDGGMLPADIPVGTIVAIGKEGVLVRPLADMDALSYVQVVGADIDQSLSTGVLGTP